MTRSREPERLDLPDQDPAQLQRSLEDVGAVNRWLGGYRALRLHLSDLRGEDRAVRILDVGAGDAATLLHLKRWAPARWRFVGVELRSPIVSIARAKVGSEEGIGIVRGDGLTLPFPDSAFDAAICTLTLHHFPDHEAVALVREMRRVSSVRVVVNDLERRRLHHWGALLLARTLWSRSPITRHDGPLSVRRSFTSGELEAVGTAAGLRNSRVRRRLVFRLILEGEP